MNSTVPSPACFRLVPATAQDARELASLRLRAMRESLERVGRFDPQRARERFLASFDPACTWHVVVDHQPVGLVVLRAPASGLLLDHLYIEPEQQGRGVGAAVLAWAFARADALGAPLHVGALRESSANRFYLRHGFMLDGQGPWDNYYVRPSRLPVARSDGNGVREPA